MKGGGVNNIFTVNQYFQLHRLSTLAAAAICSIAARWCGIRERRQHVENSRVANSHRDACGVLPIEKVDDIRSSIDGFRSSIIKQRKLCIYEVDAHAHSITVARHGGTSPPVHELLAWQKPRWINEVASRCASENSDDNITSG